MNRNQMSYGEWTTKVVQKPFNTGREGVFLTLATVVALGLAFALFGEAFFSMLPSGRYPRILLALPFLLAAGAVFFTLSPAFYLMYKGRVRPST
jgi:hypothetical protein